MHNLASNNKHRHGRRSETSLLQCFAAAARSVFTVTAVSSEPKASWVMYTVNNHTTR